MARKKQRRESAEKLAIVIGILTSFSKLMHICTTRNRTSTVAESIKTILDQCDLLVPQWLRRRAGSTW